MPAKKKFEHIPARRVIPEPLTKKTPRSVRREIIRKAGAKDRAVLDRLREYDEGKPVRGASGYVHELTAGDDKLLEGVVVSERKLLTRLLNQKLTETQAYAEDLRVKLVAEERECDFWIDEAERFRNQVVELLRERATAK